MICKGWDCRTEHLILSEKRNQFVNEEYTFGLSPGVTAFSYHRLFSYHSSPSSPQVQPLGFRFNSPEKFSIKRAVVDRLGHMMHFDTLRVFQVRNRSAHFEDPVVPFLVSALLCRSFEAVTSESFQTLLNLAAHRL